MESRIHRAADQSGRERSEITLVAVSKKFSATRILEAYEAGLRDFGENYVQEFAAKRTAVRQLSEAHFHLIGHLQTNKARLASDLFDVIQTVDSSKLLARLNAAAQEIGRTIEVMFEVKLSREQAKTGARPEDLLELLNTARDLQHLKVSGLMTMPPWSDDPEQSRPYFRQLAQLRRQHGLPKLSMGMSGDFEVAIQEGATLIRVGTALFGRRPKPDTTELALLS